MFVTGRKHSGQVGWGSLNISHNYIHLLLYKFCMMGAGCLYFYLHWMNIPQK